MYCGREKLHVLLQWDKTCICPSGKLFTDNTYHYAFMGWDGLWLLNISHNNISQIGDYAFLNLNQLRELDIVKKQYLLLMMCCML